MPWTREEKFLSHNLFGDKIIQNCLKIDASYYYDNDLLLRQDTQKKCAYPGIWCNNNWKKKRLMFLAQRMNFLQDVF